MHKLINASLFKLFRDKTFFVTMIIGVVLGFAMIGLNYGVSEGSINGARFFLSGSTVGNGFGITVPINLIVFTIGEFTYGTIRNKVIAGLSKTKIYIALLFTGFIFTIILMGMYTLITVGFGSIIGGFDASDIGGASFILKYLLYIICDYVFVVSLSVFFATMIRVTGGTISLAIVLLVFLNLMPLFLFIGTTASSGITSAAHWSMWINPLYFTGFYSNDVVALISKVISSVDLYEQTAQMMAAGILVPLLYSALFAGLGIFFFNRRDIK